MAERETSKETMKMNATTSTAIAQRPRRRLRRAGLLPALIGSLLLAMAFSASAVAAPIWEIGMSHENPWGQAGKVDPYTGSATSFVRGSSSNIYKITAANSAAATSPAGGVAVGTMLTCTGGPSAATLAYQWFRNGAAIGGATAARYTSVALDAGKELQCQVTATNSDGASNAVSIPVAVAPEPVVTPPSATIPTVSGAPNVGQTLTCVPGGWSGSPTFAYQWLRNGAPIGAATASTYTVQPVDSGTVVQCQVTGTNAGAAVMADSAKAPIVAAVPVSAATPTLSPAASPAVDGTVLTCDPGSWTNSPTFAYQWLRNGAPIGGATSSTYTVAAATDSQKAIQCDVTAVGTEASAAAATKSVVGVSNPSPLPPTSPMEPIYVEGTHSVGSTLRCQGGQWDSATTGFSFQWLRDGDAIAGASESPYQLTAADLDASVQCQVTASNAGGSSIAISPSAATVTAAASPTATASVPNPGSVSVSMQMPAGTLLSRNKENGKKLSGDGWTFTPAAGARSFTAQRSDPLAPGASYPLIQVQVQVERKVADSVDARATVGGGGAASTVTAVDPTEFEDVPFGIASLSSGAFGADGVTPYTQAGGHPLGISGTVLANLTVDYHGDLRVASGSLRNLNIDLPAGLVGNPQNAPQCPLAVFNATATANAATGCPSNSVIGFQTLSFSGTPSTGPVFPASNTIPIYNLVTPPGHPATLGFSFQSTPFVLFGSVRSDSDYGVSVVDYAVPTSPAIMGSRLTVCENGVAGVAPNFSCAAATPGSIPFLTNPTDCSKIPVTTAHVDSWEIPGVFASMESYADAPSAPPAIAGGPTTTTTPVATSPLTGCEQLTQNWVSNPEYSPTISLRPDSGQADSPAGYDVDVHVPQPESPDTLSTPALKKSTVVLPAGVSINPPAADGLAACSEQQIGLTSENPIRFSAAGANCPSASELGTMEIETPLLTKPLQGEVYLAEQDKNPFHSRFAMYLALDDPIQGVVVKVAGRVVPDPQTGQIKAVFTDNPQLPFDDLKLHFFGGPRAALANPAVCGAATTTTELSPYSAVDPDNPLPSETARPSDTFPINSGPNGSACASTPQQRPLAPGFSAGSINPLAGATSPFAMKLTRADGQQEISSLSLTTPPGFAAILRGVPYCPEPSIAAAEHATGRAEQASSSCPAASQVGTVTTSAGAGSAPLVVNGKAYFAGPYKGAPVSLVIVTPAVAGPFDLGDVVVRTALNVNPTNAQLTATTDAIPQIVEGVPLRVRSIAVQIDRPNFAINPTNCTPSSVSSTVLGSSGASATVSNRFQVGGCGDLGFKPKLALNLKGGTKRNDHPALTATLTQPPGQANIGFVQVALPHSEFLDQAHIRTVCTRVQFAAKQCPAGSIYGSAEATSPLLDQPLTGPVYLRSSDNKLPDLVAALRGPESQPIEIDLDGRIDSIHGGIRNTFEVVPDAPVSKFVLKMKGGKKGLLVNSRNICTRTEHATVRMVGQNGKRADQSPKLANGCKKSKKKTKKHSAKR
jgi:hypothetical protein